MQPRSNSDAIDPTAAKNASILYIIPSTVYTISMELLKYSTFHFS